MSKRKEIRGSNNLERKREHYVKKCKRREKYVGSTEKGSALIA
jgi:hypothetical protein